mmetsp:Transcript_23265/g.68435  ORF Transcript_23265/g.68435 Transcript_23265/m.68435 type:complete len:259 (+) Transcript_23265:1-777(+)
MFHWKCSRLRPRWTVSKRQHCGMENHLTGSSTLPPSERIMRARVGVISGRRETALPSLSVKLYICCVISSPPLRTYSCSASSTGASYSTKASWRAVSRNLAKSQLRVRISAGKKSRVPEGGSVEMAGPAGVPPLASAFFAAFAAFAASFLSWPLDLPPAAAASPSAEGALAATEPDAAAAAPFESGGGTSSAPNQTAISSVADAALGETERRSLPPAAPAISMPAAMAPAPCHTVATAGPLVSCATEPAFVQSTCACA